MMDVKDSDGLLVRLKVAFIEAAKINDAIRNDPLYRRFEQAGLFKDRAGSFVYKNLCDVQIMVRGTLGRTLYLIHLCLWKQRQATATIESDLVLFIQKAPWNHILKSYSSGLGVLLIPVPGAFHLLDFLRDELKPLMPDWLNEIVNIYRFRRKNFKDPQYSRQVFRWIFNSRSRRLLHSPRIGGEYYGHLNISRPEIHSDLFYLQQSSLSASDMVVLFGSGLMPFDPKEHLELSAHGISSVVLRPEATTDFSVPVYDIGRRLKAQNRPSIPVVPKSLETQRIGDILDKYHALRQNWAHVFRNENLKIYLSWYRYSSDHCAIADAMEENGGVTAIYQRAFDALPAPDLSIASDIVFGFSPHAIEIEKGSRSDISYFVATGYLGDHRFHLLKNQARVWRERLLSNGARKIISYFDENSGGDPRWHTGHDLQRIGYKTLCERVLNDPWMGVIFKPKVPKTLRFRLGPVADLLKEAEATGRCVVLEEGEFTGAYPPVVAALVSDLAIHSCLASGTAGVEAALAGVPTLLMDLEGWRVSPLYDLGEGRVVFRDWEQAWPLIKEYLSDKKTLPGFGDWTAFLPELDPFRDGQAAKRMGTYLDWLIQGFKEGKARSDVMAAAAERYVKQWGQDKIVEIKNQKVTPFGTKTDVATTLQRTV
ncbi:MAG: hypothetical protein KCHDKBKB_01104 [Elusimicrobia bacterium]|nr:hypothetical protein [Elusimicrobiota bacterium]